MSSGSVVGEALSVRFSGRVPRRVFWVSALLCSVLGWLVGWLYATLYMTTMTEITWDFVTVAVGAFQIWLALISVSISVRRLHDVGRNGIVGSADRFHSRTGGYFLVCARLSRR